MIFGLTSSAMAFDPHQETILAFDSDIKITDDAALIVTESIKVHSLGGRIKHGIFRDFPTRYKDRYGNNVIVGFDVLSVTRDGNPEPFHVKDWMNGKRIYVGSADVNLSPGEHLYTLSYSTNRQLGFFPDHDELYWNATGNGWDFPIENASAVVELPGNAAQKIMEMNVYTGYQGQRGQNAVIQKDVLGNPQFVTTSALAPRQGMTIHVSWPKGFIRSPTTATRIEYFISDNRGVIAVAGGVAAIVFYYLIAWFLVGRDPKKGTIIPLFYPPHELSPAGIRYLWKMGYDNKVFSSAVISLAVKGYIKYAPNSPTGYYGSHWSYTTPSHMCADLSGAFTSAIAASSHPPGSSSGSYSGGGGGFSGGGGGGGGGGGW